MVNDLNVCVKYDLKSMHPKFADILCCPNTGCDLELTNTELFDNKTIKSGFLKTKNGTITYPIINGIPRFIPKEYYSGSFGFEWSKWPRIQFGSENVNKPMEGHTRKMFLSITEFSKDEIQNKLVIEFGCGSGRFLDIVRDMGGIAIGIDMSNAVESARKNFKDDENVLIVQGDILNPPFKKNCFDYGYTIGVLHHTPHPALGLNNLVRLIKSGGKIACSVYSKKGFYNYPSVHVYRRIYKCISTIFGNSEANKFALKYAKFSACTLHPVFTHLKKIPYIGRLIVSLLEIFFFVVIENPDVDWRTLDTFDAITPNYASSHTSNEVKEWFVKSGCNNIKSTNWGNTSFCGMINFENKYEDLKESLKT